MEEIIVPVAFFGVIPLITWVVSVQRSRRHKISSEVLSKLIDRGDAITPELTQSIGVRTRYPHQDLKTGLILIAVATGLVFLGSVIPDDEAQPIFQGLASFPFLIGLVYCVFWFLFGRKSEG